MKLICLLGNKGKEYEKTRHNIAWLFFTYSYPEITFTLEKQFNAEIGTITNDASEKILIIKPQDYMNNSGKVLKKIIDYYKIDSQKDLLVVQDEYDLTLGTLKLSQSRNSAGHNGVGDIIDQLNHKDFNRLRLGIRPVSESSNSNDNKSNLKAMDHVLQNFTNTEMDILQKTIFPLAKDHIKNFIE